MRKTYTLYSIYLFFTILILTYSSCQAFLGTPMKSALEALGCGMLLAGIIISFLKQKRSYIKSTLKFSCIIVPLLSIGIILQDLLLFRKILLFFSMMTIVIIAVFSENFLRGPKSFKVMAYACMFGVIISSITCLVLGISLTGTSVEGVMGYNTTFNGGIIFKNIATMMIAIIISLYLNAVETNHLGKCDIGIMVISFIVLIASLSRGAWVHLLVFFFVTRYRYVKKIKKSQRIFFLFFLLIACSLVGIYVYKNIIMLSETYMFRYRGLANYWDMFQLDMFYICFGNSGLFYDQELDYVQTFRSITGWDGSMEIAWLNILIKTGFLGVVGFILIFARSIRCALKTDNYKQRTFLLSLIVMLLGTSMVATYIEEVHSLFGIYMYLLIAYYMGSIKKSNKYIFGDNKRYINE